MSSRESKGVTITLRSLEERGLVEVERPSPRRITSVRAARSIDAATQVPIEDKWAPPPPPPPVNKPDFDFDLLATNVLEKISQVITDYDRVVAERDEALREVTELRGELDKFIEANRRTISYINAGEASNTAPNGAKYPGLQSLISLS